jgi:hypothetical protein
MKDARVIDERTCRFLNTLEREIDLKCIEIKEEKREENLNKAFFLSCIFIICSFILGLIFNFSIISILFTVALFQGGAIILMMPLILNINSGVALK